MESIFNKNRKKLHTNIKSRFPIFQQKIHKHPLVYLDNAATTQKPYTVINAIQQYYQKHNANIHRAAHTLSMQSTQKVENTRKKIQQWINAKAAEEIIFTSGTTSSINLVAQTYAKAYLRSNDEILISLLEHHANIVPWQMVAQTVGAIVKAIPITSQGTLDMHDFEKMLTNKTKIVALVHVSSTLGIINPIAEIIQKAHEKGAIVLIDGAQSIAHMPIDVQKLDADFFTFSAHKAYGPTGLGILYGKKYLLDKMPPYQGGGAMVDQVTIPKTTYNILPYKFEAGTPPIASIHGFYESINFIQKIDYTSIAKIENELLIYAQHQLQNLPNIKIYGIKDAVHKTGIIAFNIQSMHHFDVGLLLDAKGIAVRTGLLCTQPLMDFWKLEGMIRMSLAIYNTKEDIDITIEALRYIIQKHTK